MEWFETNTEWFIKKPYNNRRFKMVKVIKNEVKPESAEILAEAIVSIGNAMDKLSASGLNENAIIILIQAETKLSRVNIAKVLRALKQLRAWYCKK